MAGAALRRIAPLDLPAVPPTPQLGARPRLQWAAPTELLVEESYQRDLTERSIRLIRKVVEGFAWSRMKPPIVVQTRDGLCVVDGQHTAIAAATLRIPQIPVFVVTAEREIDRAQAFVAHNRDRIVVTPMDVYRALLAAGDEEARDVANVCERAGVRLRLLNPQSAIAEGDTAAVGCVRALVKRRGVMRARMVLEALVKARRAPISAIEIRAAEHVLCEARPVTLLEQLTAAVRVDGDKGLLKARADANRERAPAWRVLANRWIARLDGGRP